MTVNINYKGRLCHRDITDGLQISERDSPQHHQGLSLQPQNNQRDCPSITGDCPRDHKRPKTTRGTSMISKVKGENGDFPLPHGASGGLSLFFCLCFSESFYLYHCGPPAATRHPFAVSGDNSPSQKIEFGPTHRPRNSPKVVQQHLLT